MSTKKIRFSFATFFGVAVLGIIGSIFIPYDFAFPEYEIAVVAAALVLSVEKT